MSFVQLRLCDMWTELLWNENLFAGADRCACSICTGTHSSDKKLNASVLLDVISGALCSRQWCYSCVSLMLCPSVAVFDLKAQAVLQNSFLSQKPHQLLIPGIASDVLGDRAPGFWVWSSPFLSVCLAGAVLDHELWWHCTVMQGALFMSHVFSFFGLFFPLFVV